MSKELLAAFHQQNTFKLGEFLLKSGVLSPIYVDLRVLISSPKVLKSAADALSKIIEENELEYDYIVGVPYGAIMLATLISSKLDKPMLLKRQEVKSYGTKKMIDGVFEVGKKVLIIEDVVTSGASIMETVEELRKVGLVCENVVCVLNRQQGGAARLISEGIALRSAITMDSTLDYLEEISFITAEQKSEINDALKNPKKPTGN